MKKPESTDYYKEFNDNMIIRDYLALDRTILANRRTLLAYVRTSIGLFAGGIGLVELLDSGITMAIGYISIAISVPVLVAGIIEFTKTKNSLASILKMEGKKMEHIEKEINS